MELSLTSVAAVLSGKGLNFFQFLEQKIRLPLLLILEWGWKPPVQPLTLSRVIFRASAGF